MTASTNQLKPNYFEKKPHRGCLLIEVFGFLTFQMVLIRFVFLLGNGKNSLIFSHVP